MIRVIVVENDPASAEALIALLRAHCPDVTVEGNFTGTIAVLDYLVRSTPDIVFLDIELNGETAFDLLARVPSPGFEIIFTTAFPGYALRAIKHACLEYLLKPVDKNELVTAIEKFRTKHSLPGLKQIEVLLQNLRKPEESKLCIPVADGFHLLNKSEIIMCEAEANYCVVYSAAGKIICSRNLGFVEQMIDAPDMFRCHKSFLINLNFVERLVRKDSLTVRLKTGLTAEVAVRKKNELMERLKIRGN